MSKITKSIIAGLSFSLLAACGETTIDTSSGEAFESSMSEIMLDLSPEDQKKFQLAVGQIGAASAMAAFGGDMSKEDIKAALDEKLEGKTAAEIIEDAKVMQKEMKEAMKKGLSSN